ncbi:unnamed protein product, partial [Ectocarpus sp. 8 AP-2014]
VRESLVDSWGPIPGSVLRLRANKRSWGGITTTNEDSPLWGKPMPPTLANPFPRNKLTQGGKVRRAHRSWHAAMRPNRSTTCVERGIPTVHSKHSPRATFSELLSAPVQWDTT